MLTNGLAKYLVQISLENINVSYPRRSAHTAYELSLLDIDIAALSEFRLPDEGSFQAAGAGFILF